MKKVLVTGGTRGIGKAIVEKFKDNGYDVYFTSSKTTDIKSFVESIGTIDILVNNAGVSWYGLMQDMPMEEFDKLMSINVRLMYETTKYVLPSMIKHKSGCIINIASMWGQVGASCEVAYSMSKGAVISFTKALAKEVGPSNIRVNGVSPGVIDTDMLKIFNSEEKNTLKDETPLSRLGNPEDIANAVYFLAGDNSDFITGQIIPVNGGYVI